MQKLRQLYEKYKDLIPYGIFGVCTTLVNIASYAMFTRQMGMGVMPATIGSWVLAVLFAYVTNRKWVFKSTASTSAEILKEMGSFFLCRLATGVLDWAIMLLFVELMGLDDLVIKVLSNVIVIVLNYVASKFLIFKHSEPASSESSANGAVDSAEADTCAAQSKCMKSESPTAQTI